MLFVFTAISFLVLGHEISVRLWRGSDPSLSAAERVVSAATAALALWIGTLWLVSLAGLLTPAILAGRNIVVTASAAALWIARFRARDGRQRRSIPRATIVLVPLIVWIFFSLWRGWVVPPLSHDALSYHLPKSVLYARSERYDPLPEFPARARNLPVNYELLIADVIVMAGDDQVTEWPSILFYLFYCAGAAALARRWWGAGANADLAVVMIAGAVPVALLHTGAHKNDLMTAALMTFSMVWLGRFITTADLRPLILGAATLAMAAGTKPQAAVLGLSAMPVVITLLIRQPRTLRRLFAMSAISVVFAGLLGGAYWIADRVSERAAISRSGPAGVPVSFGDWENFWQVPYVLLAAPFSSSAHALPVPWSERPWFWRRYEIYFSELGVPFALCALLLPLAIVVYRKASPETSRERLLVSVIALATLISMIPVRFRPLGMYAISTPRYMLFLVPIVLAWTLAPFLRDRRFVTPARWRAALVVAASIFIAYAVLNASRDAFVPPAYVRWAALRPGTRVIPFDPNRAASIVDRLAGEDDLVAIEAADGTWLYPAFGARLTRPVQLLTSGEPPRLHPEVKWVVIDRKFSAVWKHSQFGDLSQAGKFLTRGASPLDRDPMFAALRANPSLRLVHYEPAAGQAVFRRR